MIILIRNQIVYRSRIRVIEEIHDSKLSHQEIMALFALFDRSDSYYRQMFMIDKWTYKQFWYHGEFKKLWENKGGK
jgi:hypothetical protein